jgi:hypothetical protein
VGVLDEKGPVGIFSLKKSYYQFRKAAEQIEPRLKIYNFCETMVNEALGPKGFSRTEKKVC